MSDNKTINSLEEFLAWRGFHINDGPYYWARCFYKYTACGPWAVFILADQPARVDEWTISIVRGKNGKLQALPFKGEMPPLDVIRRFGFDTDGKPMKEDREFMTSLATYAKALGEYRDRMDVRDGLTFQFWEGPSNPLPGERRWILVGITKPVKATEKEVYYEDGNVNELVTNETCIGIKFGSIVEGSESSSGPFTHYFPFETKDFEWDEQWMEDETSFYWERDNSQWYQLRVGDRAYFLHNTWGDIKWDGKPPGRKLKAKVEEFVNEHFDDIPHEPYVYSPANPDWKPAKIPNSRAEIWEYCNDTTF